MLLEERGMFVRSRGRLPSKALSQSRLGITLLEVVVGLVLLGTLLTAILISSGKLHQQQKIALKKIEAVELLDELIASFFREGFPALDSIGDMNDQGDLYWRLSGAPCSIAPDRLSICRCTVVLRDSTSQSPDRHLASVELLVSNNSIGRQP